MSNEGELQDFAQAGETIAWLGLYLQLSFYPQIKLNRKTGLEFATNIASAMEVDGVDLESNEWTYYGAGVCDGMQIVVTKRSISLRVEQPPNAPEWYDNRFQLIVDAFKKQFLPEAIIECKAMARGLLNVTGDARAFLGANLMFMHPKKLDAMERPLHVLGVRLFFPPFHDEGGGDTEWSVNVRIESWIDDPTKLFLESDARWRTPMQWDSQAEKDAVGRVNTVIEFMNTRLMAFLHQHPFTGLEDENPEEPTNE